MLPGFLFELVCCIQREQPSPEAETRLGRFKCNNSKNQ